MHLPAVLQSFGCIAQTAMSVFETRESEIEGFIKRNILECNNVCLPNVLDFWDLRSVQCFMSFHLKHVFLFQKVEEHEKDCWDDRSELCSLKVILWELYILLFLNSEISFKPIKYDIAQKSVWLLFLILLHTVISHVCLLVKNK